MERLAGQSHHLEHDTLPEVVSQPDAAVGRGQRLSLSTANALLQKFNSYSHVKSLQPFIDVAGYEKKLAELLNPFGE
ncbi:hypothetical protein [Myxococcus xanthus]|uniref:hypothetical protein n=1 Tax=Myxococcus xanthus TaxID=34 RepID=UPI001375DF1A|nr:hypothetical protein [Myxococcus xanthus]